MESFKLRRIPFPQEARGHILGATQKRKGYCLIAIDSTLPEETQAIALRHELAHLALDHYNRPEYLADLEPEAERYAHSMTDEEFNALMKYQIN